MVERINGKTILTTPISAEDLKGIKIGDIEIGRAACRERVFGYV